MELKCPSCGFALRPKPEWAGKRGNCKKCGGSILIPGPIATTPKTPPFTLPPSAQSTVDDEVDVLLTLASPKVVLSPSPAAQSSQCQFASPNADASPAPGIQKHWRANGCLHIFPPGELTRLRTADRHRLAEYAESFILQAFSGETVLLADYVSGVSFAILDWPTLLAGIVGVIPIILLRLQIIPDIAIVLLIIYCGAALGMWIAIRCLKRTVIALTKTRLLWIVFWGSRPSEVAYVEIQSIQSARNPLIAVVTPSTVITLKDNRYSLFKPRVVIANRDLNGILKRLPDMTAIQTALLISDQIPGGPGRNVERRG